VEPSIEVNWWTQARFVLDEPVADAGPCVIDAVYSAVCVSPDSFPESIHTTALFVPAELGWEIEQEFFPPVVFTHIAEFVASGDFEICTTAQRVAPQRKMFLPPGLAT
jgi:hypothetical protein